MAKESEEQLYDDDYPKGVFSEEAADAPERARKGISMYVFGVIFFTIGMVFAGSYLVVAAYAPFDEAADETMETRGMKPMDEEAAAPESPSSEDG